MISNAFYDLLNTPNIFVSHKDIVEIALSMYITGKADFCDYLILLDSRLHNAMNFQTFDIQLRKEAIV